MPDYDAVIVPGGGVRDGGTLPPWVESRLDKALEIANGAFIIALSAGTPYRPPPLDEAGHPVFESLAGLDYLLRRGYPPERLLGETSSYDTIGNAFFCRVIHTDPTRLRRLGVVTSEVHMARAAAVFRWIFGASPAQGYRLSFMATPDKGMSAEARSLRRAKELAGLATVQSLAAHYHTLEEVHGWLFKEHLMYAAGRQHDAALPGDLLEMY